MVSSARVSITIENLEALRALAGDGATKRSFGSAL
jgi:hypothetical protein